MNSPQRDDEGICAECGATLRPPAEKCWLCGKALETGEGATGESPFAAERRAGRQFSLSSLMLTITLLAVVLGVARISPGIGIGLAIVATPALLRTCVAAVRRKSRGRPMTPREKLSVFAASLGVVLTIVVAAGAAFYATCWAGFFGGATVSSLWAEGYGPIGWGLVTGLVVGVVVAICVAILLARRLWPRKEGRKNPKG
jgi:hypothetical protein